MDNEAFSRVLTDKELEFSGWNLLNARGVHFELMGANGRANYVLADLRGPLTALEAKKKDADSSDAKEQVRGYPLTFVSSGHQEQILSN